MTTPRTVTKVVEGAETRDGAGVRLKRVIGSPQLNQLDPFLLLDEFKSDRSDDYLGGFPDHPHRGFETVTYMLAGAMEHGDHKGNKGLLGPGSAQWMTAGRGIVHSEMPRQKDGLMWGFQLWVNLPAKDKMTEPRYQDIPADRIPEVRRPDGAVARLVAGTLDGVTGPVKDIATAPLYADVRLPDGTGFPVPVPEGHHAFVYVYEGSVAVSDMTLIAGQLGVLADGGSVDLRAAQGPGKALVVAGRPLNEPVARWGPFVMNTREEVELAARQFRDGTFLS